MALMLYLLRHGQTAASRDNIYCGSGTDARLTEDGAAMARCFADRYQKFSWTAIFASPLTRTQETVRPLCVALGVEPELRDDLKEIAYGKWEGLSVDSVKKTFGEEHRRWESNPAKFAPTGGETAAEVAERGMRFVEAIRAKYTDGNILAVSHKATIRLIICALMGIDLGQYRNLLDCPVNALNVIEFRESGPMLKVLGDRAHLDERLRSLSGT